MIQVSDLLDEIMPVISYGACLGVILGLCEWLVSFFLTFALDRFKSWRGL